MGRQPVQSLRYDARRFAWIELGLGSIGALAVLNAYGIGQARPQDAGSAPASTVSHLYPAKPNPAYTLDRPLTPEHVASKYNNFYEFTMAKDVW